MDCSSVEPSAILLDGGGARRFIAVPSPRRKRDLLRGVRLPPSSSSIDNAGVFLPLTGADDLADPRPLPNAA